MDAKRIIKVAALLILTLEAFWVLYLGREPHAFNVASAVGTLFGVNSAHEHFNGKDGE